MVISANGKDENPDLPTLEMISEARKDDDFTLYMTYSDFKEGVGPGIHEWVERETKSDTRNTKSSFVPRMTSHSASTCFAASAGTRGR